MTPLDCKTVKDGLPELLAPDPQAPASATWSAAMQAHLDGCPACARERDLLVAAWLGLDRLPGLEVRPAWLAGVTAAILAADAAPAPNKSIAHQRPALRASDLRPAEARGWARWVAAAVLFGLALGGGWWVASPSRRGPVRRPPVVATADPVTEAPATEPPVTEAPDPWTEVVAPEEPETETPAEGDPFFDDLDVVLALSERPREVVGPPSPDDELVREALELLQGDEVLSDLDPEEVDDA